MFDDDLCVCGGGSVVCGWVGAVVGGSGVHISPKRYVL